MPLCIVSWNVKAGGREQVWAGLHELPPDIALLQEARWQHVAFTCTADVTE